MQMTQRTLKNTKNTKYASYLDLELSDFFWVDPQDKVIVKDPGQRKFITWFYWSDMF